MPDLDDRGSEDARVDNRAPTPPENIDHRTWTTTRQLSQTHSFPEKHLSYTSDSWE